MNQTIMFKRAEGNIVAQVFKIAIEPLDGGTKQVVFFCRDKAKKRYRVPKSEVVMSCKLDKPKEVKSKDKKKKARKTA